MSANAKSDTVQRTRQKEVVPKKSKKRNFQYCTAAPKVAREFGPEVHSARMGLIHALDDKWVNGTVLHYYFFDQSNDREEVILSDGTTEWRTWVGEEKQRDVVRAGFKAWSDLNIGLRFEEVSERDEAEIRIGFMRGDGAWSYLGRDVLEHGPNERTMNFGWDLTQSGEIDTAIHEIGHTLGFPHEHQNPFAGIVWDEPLVYEALAAPPNNWSQQKTWWNIIRKIPTTSVRGTEWDPDSIMHYPFGSGLIKEPAQYRNGLFPEEGLSPRDQTWVRSLYPPLDPTHEKLESMRPRFLSIRAGEQLDFAIEPTSSRKYQIRTFGRSDTVMVLFEDIGGELRYMTGDDDSGSDLNASIRVKLFRGRRYILRLRLYWAADAANTTVMLW